MNTVRFLGTLALLAGSGFSALVYQNVWTREFRLIFGGSTSATAAVLAIFSLGLGLGALLIGRRVDRSPNPLRVYGWLELLIAASAAATPLLLPGARTVYLALGGSTELGLVFGTILRIALATLVLIVPTALMGATLPAAVRAVVTDEDAGRGRAAWLYGLNTLGAVCGVFASTFWMLENLGNRTTLLVAAALNAAVAALALLWSSTGPRVGLLAPEPAPEPASAPAPAPAGIQPDRAIYGAAFVTGLVFFLMELVWYRMLAPILGGSVFTFGAILGVALFGIGVGGAAYGALARLLKPSFTLFGWTCLAEGAFVLGAFALGDRVAVAAGILRGLGAVGFDGLVSGWITVTCVVVAPAAAVAGFQFPLLLALLGEGQRDVATHVSRAYVANMLGGIAGSLLGGFGLLPAFSAPVTWKIGGLALCGLAVVAFLRGPSAPQRLAGLAACAFVALLANAAGPSAVWRHAGIGVGRSAIDSIRSPEVLEDWAQQHRRSILWEADGVESSVALKVASGVAFVVNGKIDGHATLDAPTQVGTGILGAILHPAAKTAMVIGLGTGGTAGWLAAVPGIERVDVAELEPRILDVARALQDVNEKALENPKVRVALGDAREFLQTVDREYDLVISEPSNPYRAGIATLFSADYYRAVKKRLAPAALFIQWVQTYEIDSIAVEQVMATVRSEFPHVIAFRTHRDLLLVGSFAPVRLDAALRSRIAEPTIAKALEVAWDTASAPEFLARYVGGDRLTAQVASRATRLVTDDLNPLEFGFARSVGRQDLFSVTRLLDESRSLGDIDPVLDAVSLAPGERLAHAEAVAQLYEDERFAAGLPIEAQARYQAAKLVEAGDLRRAAQVWSRLPNVPLLLKHRVQAAEALAEAGDGRAGTLAALLPPSRIVDRAAILARTLHRQGQPGPALEAARGAVIEQHRTPWGDASLIARFLGLLPEIVAGSPGRGGEIGRLLEVPFAGGSAYEERIRAWADVAFDPANGLDCRRAIAFFEKAPPPTEAYRSLRAQCLTRAPRGPS